MSRLPLAAVAALAAFVLPGASALAAPTLNGTVGPGFTISLTQGGKKVKTLKAGTYTFVISDKSSIHDFALNGPGGTKVLTTVPFVGTKTVTVTLKKGKYQFYCQPHHSIMFGNFTVT
jgi:plastocyanin